jgi:hypothetical protein
MGADSLFYKNTNTAKFFKVAFGEQYGTSVSSSVSVYNGIVNNVTGSPAQTGSTPYYYLINGIVDPNSGDWNWNTSSYYSPQPTPSSASFTKNVALTDAPRSQSANVTDYLTVALLNGALNGSTSSAQDIYAIKYDVYYTGSLIFTSSAYNVGSGLSASFGGPRTASTQLWSSVATVQTCSINSGSQSSGSLLIYSGIGPANLTADGAYNFSTSPWDSYVVKFCAQSGSNQINNNGVWDTFTITKSDGNCGYAGVRFAWINDYGVWDWFTFTLASDKVTNMERSKYRANFVPYNTSTTTAPYNIKRRGESYFDINLDEIFTANSDFLTQEQADWVQGLFYSPNVYIQEGSTMIPIIILDNNFASKTNPRTQKNFQYQVTFALANSKRSR